MFLALWLGQRRLLRATEVKWGLHRFKATAMTGRVYKGCGREER